jgi:hypothetical protein
MGGDGAGRYWSQMKDANVEVGIAIFLSHFTQMRYLWAPAAGAHSILEVGVWQPTPVTLSSSPQSTAWYESE